MYLNFMLVCCCLFCSVNVPPNSRGQCVIFSSAVACPELPTLYFLYVVQTKQQDDKPQMLSISNFNKIIILQDLKTKTWLKIEVFSHNNHYVWRQKIIWKASVYHPNCQAWGWQHHAVELLCCKKNWCTSQNRRHWDSHHKAMTSVLWKICGKS